MLTTYVMILFFQVASKPSITTAEFDSAESCNAAREVIEKDLEEKGWSTYGKYIICVKK